MHSLYFLHHKYLASRFINSKYRHTNTFELSIFKGMININRNTFCLLIIVTPKMQDYHCDILTRQQKSIDLQIDLMIVQISNHLSIEKLRKNQQNTQRACFKYHLAHQSIARNIQEINSSLEEFHTLSQEFDALVNKIQKIYNFDNHRNRPSSTHPYQKRWRTVRRLVFERLEQQCTMKQPFLFSEAIQQMCTTFQSMRTELYQLCQKIRKMIMIKKKCQDVAMIEQLEEMQIRRQTFYELSLNMLRNQRRMCVQRKLYVFSSISNLTASKNSIISLISQAKPTS